MSRATEISQQQIIREAIDAYVTAWETKYEEPKLNRTRRTKKAGA
jgi:hypothetical protein